MAHPIATGAPSDPRKPRGSFVTGAMARLGMEGRVPALCARAAVLWLQGHSRHPPQDSPQDETAAEETSYTATEV